MLIFTKKVELQGYLSGLRSSQKTLGFVPTMGALHEGHISLIKASKATCDQTICSIFVNPTQFNDQNDLEKYPRVPEIDTKMLEKAECDVLFMPAVEEMYQSQDKESFDFGSLDKVLEGETRPGHFNGVAQIVKMFFEIIQPNKAFFGSKDYQQVLIVKALVKQMKADIEVVACPILREPDGLAMSSRNTLLSREERVLASNILGLLDAASHIAIGDSIDAAKQYIRDQLGRFPDMKLVYYEVCDAETLQSLKEVSDDRKNISLIALIVGKIRLIDNLMLN